MNNKLTKAQLEALRGSSALKREMVSIMYLEGVDDSDLHPRIKHKIPTIKEYDQIFSNIDKTRELLLGWDKLYDASTGEEVLFEADEEGVCKLELWQDLPLNFVRELSKCIAISDDKKKL